MTFEEYLQTVVREYNENSRWFRLGMQYMNTLWSIKPALYQDITDNYPAFDCFYLDSNIPRFLLHVYRCWDKEWTNESEGSNQRYSRRWVDG